MLHPCPEQGKCNWKSYLIYLKHGHLRRSQPRSRILLRRSFLRERERERRAAMKDRVKWRGRGMDESIHFSIVHAHTHIHQCPSLEIYSSSQLTTQFSRLSKSPSYNLALLNPVTSKSSSPPWQKPTIYLTSSGHVSHLKAASTYALPTVSFSSLHLFLSSDSVFSFMVDTLRHSPTTFTYRALGVPWQGIGKRKHQRPSGPSIAASSRKVIQSNCGISTPSACED